MTEVAFWDKIPVIVRICTCPASKETHAHMANVLTIDRDEIHSIIPTVCKVFNTTWNRWVRQAIVFVGPPGTGKTTEVFTLSEHPDLVAWYNERLGRLGKISTPARLKSIPVYVALCHPDGTAPEYIGTYLPLNGVWNFQPGPMLRAWGYHWHAEHADPDTGFDKECNSPAPGILLVDDIHLMGPGGMSAMYKMMDNGRGGSFLDPFGDLIYPHEASLVMGTMNGEIDSLDPAVVDRTAVKCPVTTPSTEMLATLEEDIKLLCNQDYTHSVNPIATFREWQSISQLRPQIGLSKAVLLALGKMDRTTRLIEALGKAEGVLVAQGLIPATTEARDADQALRKQLAAAPVTV